MRTQPISGVQENLSHLSFLDALSHSSLSTTSSGVHLSSRCLEQSLKQQKITLSPAGHNFSYGAVMSSYEVTSSTSSLSSGDTASSIARQKDETKYYLQQAPERTHLKKRHLSGK
mmetsp:Transcript_7700/g.10922  ORF Transcript_7700/g.10922 Transcript_7700/m.10922 type:complete len:115 (-) Transcript_7700:210-554(-)